MQKEIENYLAHIVNDYVNWNKPTDGDDAGNAIRKEFIAKFIAELGFENGRKYIKVVRGGSVHSFIVKEDGGKFKRGDILMAASWRSPAMNFARGNILNGEMSRIRWTGAM